MLVDSLPQKFEKIILIILSSQNKIIEIIEVGLGLVESGL